MERLLGEENSGTNPADKAPLRLISLIKSETIAKKILVAMHLPADAPEPYPARGPPAEHRESRDGEDYLN